MEVFWLKLSRTASGGDMRLLMSNFFVLSIVCEGTGGGGIAPRDGGLGRELEAIAFPGRR